jgi:phosphomannomutase
MPHIFHPTILREYDIRGTVDDNLNLADATMLGRALGTMVSRAGGNHVMVGYDGRTHSPDFEAAVVEGLMATGMKVSRIGLGPTPMLYFAVYHSNASAGIMVTGSHNPPDQNGFKMLMSKSLPGGGPIYGEAIQSLAAIAAKGDFIKGTGTSTKIDVRTTYMERMMRDFRQGRSLKVVWDCGNGAAGEIVQKITAKLPGEHILLFADIDGKFPNHHPDPTVPKNLQDLIASVKKNHADFGVAFDGDGDRIGAVDGQGRIVAGDQLLAIYAEDVLKTRSGATIIADVKASQVLFDHVAAKGGKPVMWKTGHSLIKVKMAETKSPLAGEMSGHIFFADTYYGYDDAIYAALRLMNIVGASNKSLADWRDSLPQTISTPEMRFPIDESRKFKVVEDIKVRLKTAKAKVNDIDGVRVMTDDGWWLLRASNTQAVLVARAESQSDDGLRRLKGLLADQLEASGLSLPEM